MGKLSEKEQNRLKKYLHTYVRKTQERFIKEMVPVFGLLVAPPLKVTYSYLRSDGYISKDGEEVVISTGGGNLDCCSSCWKDWVRSRAYILTHEESHNLHFLTNLDLMKKEKGVYTYERQGWSEQGSYLIETVAELSSLVFYDKINRLNNSTLLFASSYSYFAPAFNLFADNRKNAEGLLRKLVKMDVKEAFKIIGPYKHFLKSPRISEDIYFGVCVKVEDLKIAS